jgi:aconitate hydratase
LTLALAPEDRIEIDAPAETLAPRAIVPVTIHRRDGGVERFAAVAQVETALELSVLRAGGIIPLILRAAHRR